MENYTFIDGELSLLKVLLFLIMVKFLHWNLLIASAL